MILPCSNTRCRNVYQDATYGPHMRVHNQCNGLVKGKQDMARCTVCRDKHNLPKEEHRELKEGEK